MELGSAIGTSTVQNRFHRTAHGHGHERSGIQHVLSNRRDPGRPGVNTAEAAAPEYPGHSVATQKYPTRLQCHEHPAGRNLGDQQLTQHSSIAATPPRSRPTTHHSLPAPRFSSPPKIAHGGTTVHQIGGSPSGLTGYRLNWSGPVPVWTDIIQIQNLNLNSKK